MFKDKFCTLDNVLDGITFDDITTAVLSNEKEVNEAAVRKVFKEILDTQMQDARHLLEKHMDNIINEVKKNRD